MKLSAIGPYLSQSEAAIIVIIAEKVQRLVESSALTEKDPGAKAEALEASYVLRSVAEQSIMDNDGELYGWRNKILASPVVKEGWIDLDALESGIPTLIVPA